MANKFRAVAAPFIDEMEDRATELGWQLRNENIGRTEGGAGTVRLTFVVKLDGDESLNGTPMGAAANGHADNAETQFAAPRAHRPEAEAE